MWEYNHTDELMHFGVKGMKWGVRRYQNKDGSLTPAGKKRMKRQATSMLKAWEIPAADRATRRYDKIWKNYEAQTKKAEKKANEAIQKKGGKGFGKYYKKSVENAKMMVTYSVAAKESEKYSKWLKTKMNEISNDTLEAGKDYVAQIKTGWGSIDYSIDFLSGKEPYYDVSGRLIIR